MLRWMATHISDGVEEPEPRSKDQLRRRQSDWGRSTANKPRGGGGLSSAAHEVP